MASLWDAIMNPQAGGLFGASPNDPQWEAIRKRLAQGEPTPGPAIDYSAIGGAAPDLRSVRRGLSALGDALMGPGPAVDWSAAGGAIPDTFGMGAQPQSLYNVAPSGFGFQQPTTTAPPLAPPGMPGGAPQVPPAMLEDRPPPLVQPTDLMPPNAQPTAGRGLPAATLPLPQPPAQYRPPAAMYGQQPAGSDLLGNLGAGFQNLLSNPTLGGLGQAITGFQTGQRFDPSGAAQQAASQTYRALREAGYSHPDAVLGATNPIVLNEMVKNAFQQPKFEKAGVGENAYLVGGGTGRLGAAAPGVSGVGGAGVTQLQQGLSPTALEESKKIGEGYAKTYEGIQTAAGAATKQIATLQRLKQLNDLAPSGAGAPAYQHARSLLTTLGIQPNSVRAGEEFTALSNKLVLDSLNGSLGTGVSNADRSFIENTVPALSQSAAGRKQLIDTMEKIARRNIEMAQLADQYRAANGSMAGFTTAAAAYAESHPLFEMPRVGSPAAAARLPRGTRFVDPNGVTRMVP